MNPETVGLIAFIITMIYTLVGLPAQIFANYRRKSMAGLSLFMNIILFMTFSIWLLYGTLKNDWYIVGSNVPGIVCIVVILGQFYAYRPSKTFPRSEIRADTSGR